jgi:peroxiredoxin
MAKLKIGDKLLNFSLPATDGKTYEAQTLLSQSQVLIVVFTCNHCPYALAWEDRINSLSHDYAEQGVKLVAINPNDAVRYPADSFEKMIVHARQKQFSFPYLYDESQEVAHSYGAERTPELFIFDKEGVLRYHGATDDNYDDENEVKQPYARQAVEAILAQQKVLLTETVPVGCTIKWKPNSHR